MLFLYENRKNCRLIFVFRFETYKNLKFPFRLGYNTKQDGRLGMVGLWRQYRIASFTVPLFLSFSCAEEENCVDVIVTGNVDYSE